MAARESVDEGRPPTLAELQRALRPSREEQLDAWRRAEHQRTVRRIIDRADRLARERADRLARLHRKGWQRLDRALCRR